MERRNPSLLACALAAVLAVSCARTQVTSQEWPDELPPVDYFERAYERDEANQARQAREQYLTWVIRFYQGWELYQDGWLLISRDLLLSVDDPAAKERLGGEMARLGRLISAEWSKDPRTSDIHTRELSIWGQALLESINRGEQEELVSRIGRDVDALLSDNLEPKEITLKRYYESTAGGQPDADS